MNHTVPLAEFYIDDSEGGRGTHYEYQREELDQLIERSKVSWDHFAGQPSAAWATSAPGRAMLLLAALRQLPIEGKHVGVWGTIEPWAECYCLAAGAERVTTIDYNRLTFHHPKMSTLTVAELTTRLAVASAVWKLALMVALPTSIPASRVELPLPTTLTSASSVDE